MMQKRCKICGNPDINVGLSGKNPNKAVCDWICASILNWKLILGGSILGLFAVLGGWIVSELFLILFVPFSLFFWYSLYLIITKRKQKMKDRLKFIGDEKEDTLNKYTR